MHLTSTCYRTNDVTLASLSHCAQFCCRSHPLNIQSEYWRDARRTDAAHPGVPWQSYGFTSTAWDILHCDDVCVDRVDQHRDGLELKHSVRYCGPGLAYILGVDRCCTQSVAAGRKDHFISELLGHSLSVCAIDDG